MTRLVTACVLLAAGLGVLLVVPGRRSEPAVRATAPAPRRPSPSLVGPSPGDRVAAAHERARQEPGSAEATDRIVAAFRSETDPRVRAALVTSLGYRAHEAAWTLLIDLVQREEHALAAHAAYALQYQSENVRAPEIAQRLRQAVAAREEVDVRCAAREAIRHLEGCIDCVNVCGGKK